MIPFIAIAGGATFDKINGITEYGLDPAANAAYDTKTGGNSVFCAKPDKDSFNID